MSAFKEEAEAEARRRGLTRPRLSARRIGLLCLLLFVPAGTLPTAVAGQHHGLAWAAGLYVAGCVLAIGVGNSRRRSAAGQAALVRWRSAVAAPVAEFDGQVIRQWMVKGDSESPDEYHVAVDDGTREVAWDFSIGSEPWRRLTPGTFVHVRVNLRDRADLAVAPVEPPAVARPLAGVAADQERTATRGLPDPEDLVTPDEAAAVLGGPADGRHVDGRHVDGRRVPGVSDGYLIGQAAGVIVPPLIAILSVHGTVPAGPERLTALLPVVEGQLRELATRMSRPPG